MEAYQLDRFSRAELELFIARRYIDDQTRVALEKILEVKSRITDIDSQIRAKDVEAKEIAADQQRLRDNIKALTETAEARQLIARYVAKADTQETRLEQLNKEKQELLVVRVRLQAELESLIRNLSIDRKLSS